MPFIPDFRFMPATPARTFKAIAKPKIPTTRSRWIALGRFLLVLAALIPCPKVARAQSVTGAFTLGLPAPPGYEIDAIAVNTETNKIYLATQDITGASHPGIIVVVDGATNNVLTTISDTSTKADQPYAIAINPVWNIIYVANTGGGATFGSVTVIDGNKDQIVGTMDDGNSDSPQALVVNPLTNTVYVANNISGNITMYSGTTRNPDTTLNIGSSLGTIGVGTGPVSLALNPAANLLYVANSGVSGGVQVNNGSIMVIDTTHPTNTPTTVTDTSGAKQPVAVAVDTSSGLAYVAENTPPSLTVISGATFITNAADPSAASTPRSVAVNPLTHSVYVADVGGGSGTVSVFQGTTFVNDVPMTDGPNVVAVDTATDIAYACDDGGHISVISGATGTQIANLQTDAGLEVVGVNPVTHKAYFGVDNLGSSTGTLAVVDGATNATTIIGAESEPWTVVVNPATNKIYVANFDDGDVTVINGATNATAGDPSVGTHPDAMVVDPVNNLIYVANLDSSSISVIDGATNSVNTDTFVTTPITPDSLAINPVLNTIYGASSGSNLEFSFPSSSSAQSISDFGFAFGGANPIATAANPATGMAFHLLTIGNGSPFLTVEDLTAPQGFYYRPCGAGTPISMDLNTATNSMFIPCSDGTINVLQGMDVFGSGTTAVIPPPSGYLGPYSAVAVNPITNIAYVADTGVIPVDNSVNPPIPAHSNVYVINGANNTINPTPITVGPDPVSIAINIATNKIYILSVVPVSGDVPALTVVDGSTNQVIATIPMGAAGDVAALNNEVAADPVNGTAYALRRNAGVNNVTAVTENTLATTCIPSSCLQTTIDTFDNNTVFTSTPVFGFTAANHSSAAPITGVYFQVDTMQGPWLPTTLSSGTYTGTTFVAPGFHMLYAYATAGDDENTSSFSGLQASPLTGAIASYGFLVAPPIAGTQQNLFLGSVAVGTTGGTQTAYLANNGAASLTYSYIITGPNSNDFIASSVGNQPCDNSGIVLAVSYCSLEIDFRPSTVGNETATLIFTDNSLATGHNVQQMIALTGTGADVTAPTITGEPTNPTGQTTATFTFTDSDPGVTSFTCQLDSQPSAPCSSGVTYSNLAATSHTFSVFGTASGVNSPATTYNWTITGATFFTLTVTEFGTGTGRVSDGGNLVCQESSGVSSGNCSSNYAASNPPVMVTLTETATNGSTFIGWGGACSGSQTTCQVSMTSSMNVTANFIPPPTTITLSFPVSTTPVTQTAAYNCPGNPNPITVANPCTPTQGPSASAVDLTVQGVSTAFQVNVTATEVPPSMFDGICESQADTSAGVLADFDCRFLNFFNYGTDPTTNGAIVPFCYPYANGNCVHYEVNGMTGTEPDPSQYLGPVNWQITWNNDNLTAPAPYWTGSTPQLYDDPDYAPTPQSAVGTSCTAAMTIGNTPQSYFCQFEFDITTFFTQGAPVDSGIGGSTKQFNDVIVAWPPTTSPNNTVLPLLNANSTPDASSVDFGEGIGFTITLLNKGTTTANNITLFDPLPTGTNVTWVLAGTTPSLPSCAISSNTLTCPGGFSVPVGGSQTFHVTSAAAGAGVYSNVATFTIGTQQTLAVATLTVAQLSPSFGPSLTGSQSIAFGTPTVTLSGTISAADPVFPPAGETVTITIAGISQAATIGANGVFSAQFSTKSISASTQPYPITYRYAGDANFAPLTNSSTTLTVTPAATSISISAPAVTFPANGVVKVTVSAANVTPTGNVTLKVDSGSPLTAALSAGVATFTITSPSPGTHTLSASYAAQGNFAASGPVTGTLTVNGAALAISPTSVNFGNVYLNTFSTRFVTLTNNGSSSITISKVTIPGSNSESNLPGDPDDFTAVNLCPSKLAAGKSCLISVIFGADGDDFNLQFATLTITDTAAGSPQTVPLTATVINPQVSLSPNSLSFGNQKTGTTSAVKSVTLKNSGNSQLNLTGLSISSNFAFATGTKACTNTTSLAPNATCVIYVTFKPTSKGQKSGSVTITDNALNSPQHISLSGNGN